MNSLPIQSPALQDGLFLEDVEIKYGTHPSEIVLEAFGDKSNINKGYGGKNVWLVPKWTRDPNRASTSFSIQLTNAQQPGRNDLTNGSNSSWSCLLPNLEPVRSEPTKSANMPYCYLERQCENDRPTRVRQAFLIRTPQLLQTAISNRWIDGWTGDINRGRGGKFLYLVWKNVPNPGWMGEIMPKVEMMVESTKPDSISWDPPKYSLFPTYH